MQAEIYALPYKLHAFHLQAQLLLSGRAPSQFNLATGAEYALPGEFSRDRCFQKARDGTMIAGISSSGSHLAVACDPATWDGTDRLCKGLIADFGGGRTRHCLALNSGFDLDLRGVALDFELRAERF